MTRPGEDPEDKTDGVGNVGSLAAASEEDPAAGDPLGPLNAVTEDDENE